MKSRSYLLCGFNEVEIGCRPLVSVHIRPRYLFAVASQSEAVAIAARSYFVCPLSFKGFITG